MSIFTRKGSGMVPQTFKKAGQPASLTDIILRTRRKTDLDQHFSLLSWICFFRTRLMYWLKLRSSESASSRIFLMTSSSRVMLTLFFKGFNELSMGLL